MAGPNLILQFLVQAHGLSTGEPRTKSIQNVYNFRRTVPGGAPLKSAAATAFKTSILTPLGDCLSVSYVTDYLNVRWLDDPYDPYLTSALALNGTIAGDSLPTLNSAYVELGTGFRGQTNRGSKHYCPISEASTVLDHLSAGALTLFGTFCTALVAGFTASDGCIYVPYLVSQKYSYFDPTTAVVSGNDITTAVTRTLLGQMKRRAEYRR